MPVAGALRAKFRRRRSPAEDKVSILEREERRELETPTAPEGQPEEEELAGCDSKTVAFATLPDNYQPLTWDGEQLPRPKKTERASKARKRRLKKYGKNVGKVLQKGCSYMILGLQGLARAYSSPLGLAAWTGTSVR
ncbi:required for drug-induced death protein 1 [Ahaetulla prasina]|uniref:required for drug-induced death protein 1 n=1 Tax=Ahaetulla prasina TaxID=499056 RepID=UPI00264A0EAE|nr:required for drug-induced death protein 1 [Ahaetulla prasina]